MLVMASHVIICPISLLCLAAVWLYGKLELNLNLFQCTFKFPSCMVCASVQEYNKPAIASRLSHVPTHLLIAPADICILCIVIYMTLKLEYVSMECAIIKCECIEKSYHRNVISSRHGYDSD